MRDKGGHAWQRGVCIAKGGMAGSCMAGGMHSGGHVWWGGMHGRGEACMAGGMHGREHVWQGACMAGACVAGEMATAADGTHPTGMHSCYES